MAERGGQRVSDASVEETLASVLDWLRWEPDGASEEELSDLVVYDIEVLRRALALGIEIGRLALVDGTYRWLAQGTEG
jgi:hypothetical protein